jgi:hypothetical protein
LGFLVWKYSIWQSLLGLASGQLKADVVRGNFFLPKFFQIFFPQNLENQFNLLSETSWLSSKMTKWSQSLPDFSWYNIPKREKYNLWNHYMYNNWQQNIPIDHKIYKMDTQFPRWP